MRVAITGGAGEGKSTVLALVARHGFAVASADDIAREVFVRPDIHASLARAAGLATPMSPADLRAALTNSPEIRRAANRITHPPILEAMARSSATFVEVPLLVEACLTYLFDEVWVVTCGVTEQRRRLLARYQDPAAVDAMLASQLPTRVKIAFADQVIRTNRSLAHVTGVVSVAVSGLKQ